MVGFPTSTSIPYLSFEDVEPLFWPSLRPDEDSAWHGHVAFGHWIVQAAAPRVVVELGTHSGVSFAAFCNAAARSAVPPRLYAVDTWKGDEHSGFYSEEVFLDMAWFNAQFESFSTLMRCRFDEAVRHFPDSSIDLLHIDGLHTYEAVRHDLETWSPKLSNSAVVLFHDIELEGPDFGVNRFWGELRQLRPSFQFHHSSGLGVLAVGAAVTKTVLQLCHSSMREQEQARECFLQASAMARHTGSERARQIMNEALASIATTGRNVALNKPAFQSSADPGSAVPAGGANNGLKTGRYGFHTRLEENPWWLVDLQGDDEFDEILVFNRLDSNCKYRAASLRISLSADLKAWHPIYAHDGSIFGGADGRPLRVGVPGSKARFVRFELAGFHFFHLDEVEIYKY